MGEKQMSEKTKVEQRLERTLSDVRKKTDFKPLVALVLGSGLGGFADCLKVEKEIPYS